MSCPRCKATLYKKEVQAKFGVCNECGNHFTVSARERIRHMVQHARALDHHVIGRAGDHRAFDGGDHTRRFCARERTPSGQAWPTAGCARELCAWQIATASASAV